MAIPKLNFPNKSDNGNTTKEKSMSVMHMDLNVTENTNLEVFLTCLGLVRLTVDFDCNYWHYYFCPYTPSALQPPQKSSFSYSDRYFF